MIEKFTEESRLTSVILVTDHMFWVIGEEKDKLLEEDRAQMFNHAVAQFLFMSTIPRRDIHTEVSFLTTRLKLPGEDDWGKPNIALK